MRGASASHSLTSAIATIYTHKRAGISLSRDSPFQSDCCFSVCSRGRCGERFALIAWTAQCLSILRLRRSKSLFMDHAQMVTSWESIPRVYFPFESTYFIAESQCFLTSARPKIMTRFLYKEDKYLCRPIQGKFQDFAYNINVNFH